MTREHGDKSHHFLGTGTDPQESNDLEGARKGTVGARENWVPSHILFPVPSKTSLTYSLSSGQRWDGHRKPPQWPMLLPEFCWTQICFLIALELGGGKSGADGVNVTKRES